ncbi:MAG: DUF512 domain-containing protein [Chloroflexi bacterium]|nr:DUF512 domain-containing protein [Chloroflexota bacterium]
METTPNREGVVIVTAPDDALARLGIQPGDRLIAVNGRPVRDVVDYQFHAAEGVADLVVERAGQTVRLSPGLDGDDRLGLTFEAPTGDGIRTCANKCPFCFLKGLPRGMRKSLYVKDDDFRYSFLYGNFITLSNLVEADWARLAEQRLSPLYVSVHATEPDLHRTMLGNARAPDVVAQIRRLASLGIQVHTQVVLCPELNDGAHLDRTIADLAAIQPAVRSIAVVPVGLTPRHGQYRSIVPLRLFRPDEGRAVLRQLQPHQRRFRRELGRTLVYASDEFYLMAGQPVPGGTGYDGFPQYENGVGMVRVLLDHWRKAARRLDRVRRLRVGGRVLLLCGTLIAPLLRPMVDALRAAADADVELLPVENRFFGATVTVSGLLTAGDVRAALDGRARPDCLVLPRTMLDRPGDRFLDDVTPADLKRDLTCSVLFLDHPGQLVE